MSFGYPLNRQLSCRKWKTCTGLIARNVRRVQALRRSGDSNPCGWLLSQPRQGDPLTEAKRYIDLEKGVPTAEDAIQGAMDIIAEQLADDAKIRAWVRKYTFDQGILRTEAKDAKQETVYEAIRN